MLAERVRQLNTVEVGDSAGPVVYWMSRDQRAHDNWALAHAIAEARRLGVAVCVVFCLRPKFLHGTERVVDFMLAGLLEVEAVLRLHHIGFHFLVGSPEEEIPQFVHKVDASALVLEQNPLRVFRSWEEAILEKVSVPVHEVDAHNIVPVWCASQKQEFGAYTLRPKLHRVLPKFLEESVPPLRAQHKDMLVATAPVDWKKVRARLTLDTSVPAVDWARAGEKAARQHLKTFIAQRLETYASDRNDPTKDAQSGLSPYLHFGHISAATVVREVLEATGMSLEAALRKYPDELGLRASVAAFVEELVVRRELSDNFCFYNAHYDTPAGFPEWAKKNMQEHAGDAREHVYTRAQFEQGATHDELWNAAQLQLVQTGKMHGYMRMYWAKKILEWTKTVSAAMRVAIYLNDRYSLDGRDPNGYVGIAWSIGGVHDRAWFTKPIFGKIRYMSYGGAKTKFDVQKYIDTYKKG